MNAAGTIIVSGSTDKILRVWDTRSAQRLMMLRGHTDNIRAIVLSRDGKLCLSAGSDGSIRLWCIGQQRCVATFLVHDEGVWALQANDAFTHVYSGGRDRRVVLTDIRQPASGTGGGSGNRRRSSAAGASSSSSPERTVICLETAPILKLLVPPDERSIWVATTDSSIKCWPLQANTTYDRISSLNGDHIALKEGGVTKLGKLFEENGGSTTKAKSKFGAENGHDTTLETTKQPLLVIKGNPAIRAYRVLSDRRHILTKDTDDNAAVYDVLKVAKVEDLGTGVDLELEAKRRYRSIYVPNWFTVDLKMGLLTIHLDDPECFSAWVWSRDFGFQTLGGSSAGSDSDDGRYQQLQLQNAYEAKVNLGMLLLQALFEYWPHAYQANLIDNLASLNEASETSSESGDTAVSLNFHRQQRLHHMSSQLARGPLNQFFSVPNHTPIILSETAASGSSSQRTLLRLRAIDERVENEDLLLQETMPNWISDIVVHRKVPGFPKISFYIYPHASLELSSVKKEHFSAIDMLQIRKVVEHIYSKLCPGMFEDDPPLPPPPPPPPHASASMPPKEMNGHGHGQQQQQQQRACDSSCSTTSSNSSTTNGNNHHHHHHRGESPADNNSQSHYHRNGENGHDGSSGSTVTANGQYYGQVTVAEQRIELLCNDQVLDPNMDLRTVKHFIWRQSGDLMFYYRLSTGGGTASAGRRGSTSTLATNSTNNGSETASMSKKKRDGYFW